VEGDVSKQINISKIVNSNSIKVDLEDLKPDIYFLKIEGKDVYYGNEILIKNEI
jgi:hypothetical protein